MKFRVGQPIWAIFHPDDGDEGGSVREYGRFAGTIQQVSIERKTWRYFWRRYDWDVVLPGCPNGDSWAFDENLLEPRDPDQFARGEWAECEWQPGVTSISETR